MDITEWIIWLFTNPMFYAILFGVGLLGAYAKIYFFKKKTLSPKKLLVFGAVGFLLATFGTSWLGVGSIGGSASDTILAGGVTSVLLHDGLVNATTTSDFLNDAEDEMTFYITDANILDGEEILFNVTLRRDDTREDHRAKVTCYMPDQKLTGVTLENLIESTNDDLDIDINDAGDVTKNTIVYYADFTEGDGEVEIQIAYDQEETWEDGMTAYDTVATLSCNADGVPFMAHHIAVD